MTHIFRSYDIRGIYGTDIDEGIAERIGMALASRIGGDIAAARDMRASSESIMNALVKGLTDGGKNVHSLGLLPLGPSLYFSWKNKKYLAYVTASHLPKEWAGVKFFHADGCGFVDSENYAVRDAFVSGVKKNVAKGKLVAAGGKQAMEDYKAYLLSKISARKKNIVIDCGNGTAGMIAKDLFEGAGFSADVLFEELDGSFPNRPSEPSDESLGELKKAVIGRDFGIAFDGDGDRMVFVDDSGKVTSAEQIAYILLEHLLKKENKPIVANVECSRIIDAVANKFSSEVHRIRVGHPYLVREAALRKACLGIEPSGHYVLPELFPFDDAIGISLYVAAVISSSGKKLSELVKSVPVYPFGRVNLGCPDDRKFSVIDKLSKNLSEKYKNVSTLDGVRVDFEEGWILVRASNTSPVIRLTIEAKNEKEFKILEKEFSEAVKKEVSSAK